MGVPDRGAEETDDVVGGPSEPGPAWLVISSASGLTSVPLPTKIRSIIGRSAGCDVVVDDRSVSREHAAIFVLGGRPRIEDLRSRNRTRVMGHTLAPGETVELTPGAVVEIGRATLLLTSHPPVLAQPLAGDGSPQPRRSGAIIEDPTMQRLYGLLGVIAPSSLNVLLFGETGTGKEVFAEAIHHGSARASRAFLRINSAGLSGTLLESELFGHEKGAFTGAVAAKPGLFEAADGGTLFLDEIGEMPLETQAKLLRVIECGEVSRLGSSRVRKVDVRYIGATHRDLASMIEAGRFRADLYFRLNGFAMTLPPLRERPADVVVLARHFLDRKDREAALDPATTPLLQAYSWPGNVRELKSVIERALVLAGPQRTIKPSHLQLTEPPRAAPSAPAIALDPPGVEPDGADLRGRRDSWEKAQIERALEASRGSRKKAAELLGLSYRTLLNRMAALGIERPAKD